MSKVLILSNRDEDAHVQGVVTELEKLGHSWVLFDPGEFPSRVQFSASLHDTEKQSSLVIEGQRYTLEDVTSVWYRRPSPIILDKDLPPLEKTFIEREATAGLWGWLRGVEALWVNPIDAIRTASHKPQQLQLAQSLGLCIPRTVITNDAEAFKAFYEACHGNVIYKMMGYPWYVDSNGLPTTAYTSRVPKTMLEQAQRVTPTAHLFQEFIEKKCDLRVILIGEEVFATEIYGLSEETVVDFRVDYSKLRYANHTLPDYMREALLSLNRAYHLVYSAIDLVLTPDGRYIFLEVNAVGQFGWLEGPTGIPLYHTLAKLLGTTKG